MLYISNDMAVTIEGIDKYCTVNSACGQVKRGIWCAVGFIIPAVPSLLTQSIENSKRKPPLVETMEKK